MHVWDAVTGQLLRDLKGHKGSVNAVAFNATATRLYSVAKGVIKVWDLSVRVRCWMMRRRRSNRSQ